MEPGGFGALESNILFEGSLAGPVPHPVHDRQDGDERKQKRKNQALNSVGQQASRPAPFGNHLAEITADQEEQRHPKSVNSIGQPGVGP